MKGMRLSVSMAKYKKGGAPAKKFDLHLKKRLLISEKSQIQPLEIRGRMLKCSWVNRKRLQWWMREKRQSLSISQLKLLKNEEIVKMLDQAIIAENSDVINIAKAEKEVAACSKNVKSMYFLSPTRVLIVFDCKTEASNVVSVKSAVWDVFDDIRLWSKGDLFDDRLVWIECHGIHPKCWSTDNVRKIREKWGPILCIENRVESYLCPDVS